MVPFSLILLVLALEPEIGIGESGDRAVGGLHGAVVNRTRTC